MTPNKTLELLLRRIEGEYLEMPGLQLTREQAQRLWALDHETCSGLLDVLVMNGFLVCGPDSRYRRTMDGPALRSAAGRAKSHIPMHRHARRAS
jgi:hypothetical protein